MCNIEDRALRVVVGGGQKYTNTMMPSQIVVLKYAYKCTADPNTRLMVSISKFVLFDWLNLDINP